MRAYALRHADRLSGAQVLAVLDDYDGVLLEDGQPITRERLEREGKMERFIESEFQYQNDPSRFLCTSAPLTVQLEKPVCLPHWTRGAMLLVGPALGLLPGLAMGQRLIGETMLSGLLDGFGLDHVKWLSGRHDERQAKQQQVVVHHEEPPVAISRMRRSQGRAL